LSARVTKIRVVDIVVAPKRMRKLREDKVASIAESIAVQGLLEPIAVRPRGPTNYWLVFGRHRLEAVRKCGHTHIRAAILDGLNADAALLAEIDENLMRAELSPAERALHLAERKRVYEKLHPKTRRGVAGAEAKHGRASDRMSFAESTAKATGKSKRTIQREVERALKIHDLANVVDTSFDAPDQLDALAKLPEAMQRDFIHRAKAGERVQVKVAVMKARRKSRELELAAGTEAASNALGKKLYGVIYADPPWRYDNVPMGDVARMNEQHYPSMPLDQIKALPIPAADDCVLFLWATVPLLPEAIDVMKAWGFTYKSASTWIKDKAGTGYWVRGVVEHLLIGRRGDVPSPAPGDQFPGVIEAPRKRHSEKPDIFAEHIERLFPNVPKLEMFARKARRGWNVWGNEVLSAEAAE
jgi:ParB/RepB/Spo0J family partition protein